jgi:hypothetical protein
VVSLYVPFIMREGLYTKKLALDKWPLPTIIGTLLL